jgi:multicomponent Na+:H+ antiporter subunit F
MNLVLTILFLIAIVLGLIYLLWKKDILHRLLILGYITNVMIALICFYALLSDNHIYIDIALIYALLAPISTIAFIRFLKHRQT